MVGIPMGIINQLKNSEIQILWSVLNKFFGEPTTADEYNKPKEEK